QAEVGSEQPTEAGPDKVVQIFPSLTVELLHTAGAVAANVEFAIRAEGQPGRFEQIATDDEHAQVFTRGAVVAKDLVIAVAGDVEVAVRAERHVAGAHQFATPREGA